MQTMKFLFIHRTPYFYQRGYIFRLFLPKKNLRLSIDKSVRIRHGLLSPQSSESLSESCFDEQIQARLRNCNQLSNQLKVPVYCLCKIAKHASEVLAVGVSRANLIFKLVIENWIFIWEQTNFRLQSL